MIRFSLLVYINGVHVVDIQKKLNHKEFISIGRNAELNEIAIKDEAISRQHFQIVYKEGKLILRRISKVNPVFLNDTEVDFATLENGNNIRIGNSKIIIKLISLNDLDALELDGDTRVC